MLRPVTDRLHTARGMKGQEAPGGCQRFCLVILILYFRYISVFTYSLLTAPNQQVATDVTINQQFETNLVK